MSVDRIVIVGASLAGVSAARAIRMEGFEGSVSLVGDEIHRPYDRPPLSKEILTGLKAEDEIELPGLADLDVEWRLGTTAVALDRGDRTVLTSRGDIGYDGLIIATGVRSRPLPGLPVDNERVFALRSLDDARALGRALESRPRVLIVGSGFIGVEVAVSARALGCETSIVSMTDALIIAGPEVSRTCTSMLMAAGITLHTERRIERTEFGSASGVMHLDNGVRQEFDIIVVAIGSVPNVEWLAGSGLDTTNGVLCDETCTALGSHDVIAVGDIARWPNPLFGGLHMRIEHWANAVEQGTAGGRNILRPHSDREPFSSLPSFWSDHGGPRLQSIGLPGMADRLELVDGELGDGRYALAAYKESALVGAIGYGVPRAIAKLRASVSLDPATKGSHG